MSRSKANGSQRVQTKKMNGETVDSTAIELIDEFYLKASVEKGSVEDDTLYKILGANFDKDIKGLIWFTVFGNKRKDGVLSKWSKITN